jgi:ABC-type multidrug transport system fused ATPase/permease subunit
VSASKFQKFMNRAGGAKKETMASSSESSRASRRDNVAFALEDVNLYYGDFQALNDITFDLPTHQVTAFIGPSGCGKSTLLRCFNRMNDLIDNCRVEGAIYRNGVDIYGDSVDVVDLRTHVGMVFQQPNPFPKSIYDNVAYGLVCQGVRSKKVLDEAVESSLKKAAGTDTTDMLRVGRPTVRLRNSRLLFLNFLLWRMEAGRMDVFRTFDAGL